MSDTETDTDTEVDFSGDGDDREDLTPGGDSAQQLFDDVSEDYDYEGATETWIGEPATTELSIETVDGIDVKQFVLEEPDDPQTMERLLSAVLQGNLYEFCRGMVREPTLTPEIWDEKMVERERHLLFDSAFAWGRFGEFDSMAQRGERVQEALEATR